MIMPIVVFLYGSYHLYVTDLGNVRAVTDASGTIEKTFDYYPFGESYESVASANPGQDFRYGGKQTEDKFGNREVYDFSARWYSPVFGRFQTMDPLCEKYYSLSPYAYCANNPMNVVDPSGEEFKRIWRHNEIIIKTTIYYLPGAKESARLASNFWNNRNTDAYVKDDVTYPIRYDISIIPIASKLKDSGDNWNTYEVVPSGRLISKKDPERKLAGQADGPKNNILKIDKAYSVYFRGRISTTGAHEIGHLLGMKHKQGTVMSVSQDNERTLDVDQDQINMMIESGYGLDEYSIGYKISKLLWGK